MDKPCIAPGAATGAGALTTFYAYDGGTARSQVLAQMASALAGAGAPVLMIDWDLESPGLHHLSGSAGERPGLVEFITACRDQLAALAHDGVASDADRAHRVLAAVDWRAYIERVDDAHSLYLMRAGCVDDSYGERAAQLDWHALFQACPALLRAWRGQMAQAFRHVFIDARGGRSAAVSVCTSLLPDHIVGLFTPAQRSLDGLCGVVRRAIAYRCSHEDEQHPLLLYPLPCAPAEAGSAEHFAWRRGAAHGQAGYQAQLEALMQSCYGRTQLSLESYCDKIVWQQADAVERAPTLQALCDGIAGGRLPWEVHATVRLQGAPGAISGRAQFPALRRVAVRRAEHAAGVDTRRLNQLADAVEVQLDHLQQLVDRQALHEARPVADRLRQLVLRPAVAHAMRRRGAALIKLVYRHDNDTDALLAFTQDELASLEHVLNEAVAGRPLLFS